MDQHFQILTVAPKYLISLLLILLGSVFGLNDRIRLLEPLPLAVMSSAET